MENPLLYYSSPQVPYLDAMNSASHPGTRSIPHRQRDRFSSVASGLDDFQTVQNMNNYLSPGPDSFYNTPAQLDDDVMGIDKKWSRSPVNLNVSRISTTTSLFCCEYLPLQTDFSVRDPLHDILANEQGLGLMEQLEACGYGYLPSGFQPQGIARERNFPTNAPPFNQVTPQGPCNAQHIGSRTIHYNDESVPPAAHPRQPSSTNLDFSYAAPPQISDPPYLSTNVAVSPTIKSEHNEPSNVPADSDVFTTYYPTQNMIRDIKPEFLDTLTPSHHSCDVSELNDFEFTITAPIPRRQRRRRQGVPTATRSKAVESSNTATSPRPTPPPSVAGNVESPTTVTPGRPTTYFPNSNKPEPSTTSVDNKAGPGELFFDMTFHHQDPGDEFEVRELDTTDIPSIKDHHEPNASEPRTAQQSAAQPVRDADSNQKPTPQKNKRKRPTFDAIPPETQRHPPAKKPRKKTSPRSLPKPTSDDPRRIEPTFLYFCVEDGCPASLNHRPAFGGFKAKEDAARHLTRHEPPRFICSRPHSNGKDHTCNRSDNLRA